MRRFVLALAFAACGPTANGVVRAQLTVAQGLSASDLQSMYVFVLENETASGMPLTCTDLLAAPLSTRTDLVPVYHQFLPFTNAKLDSIPVGKNLFVAIETYASPDGSGMPTGHACTGGVVITKDAATSVNLTLTSL